jgi:hypothetical protein
MQRGGSCWGDEHVVPWPQLSPEGRSAALLSMVWDSSNISHVASLLFKRTCDLAFVINGSNAQDPFTSTAMYACDHVIRCLLLALLLRLAGA